MSYILAIDQGTTSCRALLFDHLGQKVSMEEEKFAQYFPKVGLVEHDADQIWSVQKKVIERLMQKASLTAKDINCLAITNQRETTVLWDKKSKKALYHAIVWQDRRTTDLCEKLKKEGKESLIKKKTGLLCDPYFSATKIRWLLDHTGKHSKDICVGTIDSWLIFNLTGGKSHHTDVTNASRTLLFNIDTLKWDKELLELFSIPEEILPSVLDSSSFYGEVSDIECLKGVPICGVAGDQSASLFGHLCLEKGETKCTYGTGCFILMNTGHERKSSSKLLETIAYKTKEDVCYALEGSIFMAGALIEWVKNELALISTFEELESLALQVSDSGGVYFVPSFTGLGAPYWEPLAKGSIFGLTRGTKKAHLARASLEGIAFQVHDVLESMEQETHLKIPLLKADGKMVSSNFLMQCQANLQNCIIEIPNELEVTARGAAFLAGLHTKFFKSKSHLKELIHTKDKRFPEVSKTALTQSLQGWKEAVFCTILFSKKQEEAKNES